MAADLFEFGKCSFPLGSAGLRKGLGRAWGELSEGLGRAQEELGESLGGAWEELRERAWGSLLVSILAAGGLGLEFLLATLVPVK